MSEPVLRVAGYRFRATFRRRWGGYLTLALLIGLVGGVALGSLTAARRTYASYPAFLASTNPSDLLVLPSTNGPDPGLVHELARLPHVRSAEAGEQLTAVTLTPRGGVGTVLITQVELIASPDGLFTDQDRLKIAQGRAANPARADEVVATNEAASVLGLHVGSRIPVGIQPDNATGPGSFRKTELTVVGIGVLGIQLVHDDIDTNRAGFLVGTPALLWEYESCCATNSYDGLQLDGGSHSDVPALQEYEHLIDNKYTNYGQLVVYETSAIEAEAQQAIRPEAIALAVFGLIALLAALIIGTQSISRQLHAGAGETAVLRALGAAPAATMADGLLGVTAATVAGALIAAAVAVALSPLTLFGPVAAVEPAPGIDADWTVLGLGVLAAGYVLAGQLARSAVSAGPDAGLLPDGGLAAYRGDGAVSRWLGGLVQGRLPPLPPVLVGLLVTCVLAALGLGNLPGILVLTPVEAMLLASLGACHPHDGRLDWLVPALLQTGECIFLAALGFSRHVPAAVVFALLAAVTMRHVDLAYRARSGHGIAADRFGLGWDGRMLLAGVAAVAGIAPLAYAVLAGYLWLLFCWDFLSGWLLTTVGDHG